MVAAVEINSITTAKITAEAIVLLDARHPLNPLLAVPIVSQSAHLHL